MSQLFFSWELGQNYGHLSKQLAIAKSLQKKGHSVFFAVRDCTVAAELLSIHDISYTQAPFWHSGNNLTSPPLNYAELLLADGYGSFLGLQGMVDSWVALYHSVKPDIIIIDHSPTSLLAATLLEIPVLQIGTGFVIPPDEQPFPSIRPWEKTSELRLLKAEKQTLETINLICRQYNKPCFENIQSLMHYGVRLITSFAELDHYGARQNETYIGPIYTPSSGGTIPRIESDLPSVFAYLRPSIPGLPALLRALVALSPIIKVTLVIPGIRQKQAEFLLRKGLQVYSKPINLDQFCEKASFAITYGNFGTVNQFLLSGIPVLLVPQNVEQYILSQRVEDLGAGLMARQNRSQKDFTDLLMKLLQSSKFRQQARIFAKQYNGYLPKQAVDLVVSTVEKILQ